jgi:hypothetical protein
VDFLKIVVVEKADIFMDNNHELETQTPFNMFSSYILTDESRNALLERFPHKHEKLVAHHVTFKYPDHDIAPPISKAMVVGYSCNDSCECLVVELDDTSTRPDGAVYHITWSLRPGVRPVYSNTLIKKEGWTKLEVPVPIDVINK